MAKRKRQEAKRLRADTLRLQRHEEDLGDQAKIWSERHNVQREWITDIERDLKLTESEMTEKNPEFREEKRYVEIHRQAAKRFRGQEKEKREKARDKIREAELLCSQADAQCVRGLPERAMGNFAVAKPILERALDLQLQGLQAKRDAEELLRSADEAERKFDRSVGRAFCLAHVFAEDKKKECLRLREEGEAIGKQASQLKDQVQVLEQQASDAENEAIRILQLLDQGDQGGAGKSATNA